MSKTATLVMDNLGKFQGEASLYRLSEPIAEYSWDDEEVPETHEYVIVSAAVAMMSGPETYIFPADKDGSVLNWGELDGSYRGGLSHQKALRNAGYDLATQS